MGMGSKHFQKHKIFQGSLQYQIGRVHKICGNLLFAKLETSFIEVLQSGKFCLFGLHQIFHLKIKSIYDLQFIAKVKTHSFILNSRISFLASIMTYLFHFLSSVKI